MAKTTEKHKIAEDIYIYKTSASRFWMARFKISSHWLAKTTKEKDHDQAKHKASQLQMEYRIKAENNLPIFTSSSSDLNSFKAIANKAIERMNSQEAQGTGKRVFKDYIQALNKYHIPYFNKISIRNIDARALISFDDWRIEQLGRVPKKSTINNHNAAMQRVFDEAIIGKHITASELPPLKNLGKGSDRRAAFSPSEYTLILDAASKWIGEGRKQVTKDTRRLLYYYIQFAAMTGIRPGTEMEQLTWGDVHSRISAKGNPYTMVTVRKGKTTLYTGIREIVCLYGSDAVLDRMKDTLIDPKKDDLIFTLPNGRKSSELSRNFSKLLNNLGLKSTAFGVRVLYSLRHSYITWSLQRGLSKVIISKQCGTSEEMIERHYSHVEPSMFADELSGNGNLNNANSGAVLDLSNVDINDYFEMTTLGANLFFHKYNYEE